MMCRSVTRGHAARAAIVHEQPSADIEVVECDLASLGSVREAASMVRAAHSRIDLLINNAATMWTPHRTTEDGFELQLATNHLGHFALTGLLMDQLRRAAVARVVVVASRAHREGRIELGDLQMERRYGRHRAYARSKLANLLFAYELANRLRGSSTIAVAAHPGAAATDITRHAPRAMAVLNRVFGPLMTQSAAQGALPILRAACDPSVANSDYFGPSGFAELRGAPVRSSSSRRSHDAITQRRLFEISERLTGVTYDV
jgi:NAD(P)-dependent dehydrogenase (short-subunit alcohol dehydrogenase family)